MKTIEIKCKGAAVLDISKIEPFQGDLKTLSKKDYDKLRKQILELGFSEPIGVWKDGESYKCISGHQRLRVLTELRNTEKYHVPEIPISIIEASSEFEAKKKILAMAAAFGEVTGQGLMEFASLNNIDLPTLEDFRFPEIDMETWKQEFFDEIVETEMPELNSEEESPEMGQMTFLLHKDQIGLIEEAISNSKALGDFGETGNKNSNGNALHRICELFLEKK